MEVREHARRHLVDYCLHATLSTVAFFLIGTALRRVLEEELVYNTVYRGACVCVTLLAILILRMRIRRPNAGVEVTDQKRTCLDAIDDVDMNHDDDTATSACVITDIHVCSIALFLIVTSTAAHAVLLAYPGTVLNSASIALVSVIGLLTFSSFSPVFVPIVIQRVVMATSLATFVGVAMVTGTLQGAVYTSEFMCVVIAVGAHWVGMVIQRGQLVAWQRTACSKATIMRDQSNVELVVSELLPSGVHERLRTLPVERWHEIGRTERHVTVLFLSLCNLAMLSEGLTPADFVGVVHAFFAVCDRLLQAANARVGAPVLTKIEAVKDQYLVCGGMGMGAGSGPGAGPGGGGVGAFAAATFGMDVIRAVHGRSVCDVLGCPSSLSSAGGAPGLRLGPGLSPGSSTLDLGLGLGLGLGKGAGSGRGSGASLVAGAKDAGRCTLPGHGPNTVVMVTAGMHTGPVLSGT